MYSSILCLTNFNLDTVHGQNQLICNIALKSCHISSQNAYISESKLDGGLKLGQNIQKCILDYWPQTNS